MAVIYHQTSPFIIKLPYIISLIVDRVKSPLVIEKWNIKLLVIIYTFLETTPFLGG